MLTGPIHFLFVYHIFGCVREEDNIIFSTKVHPNEVGGRSSDGQDDVFLRGEVKGDPPHGQLAGEQQKLPHSWGKEIRRNHSHLWQRHSPSKRRNKEGRVTKEETNVDG